MKTALIIIIGIVVLLAFDKATDFIEQDAGKKENRIGKIFRLCYWGFVYCLCGLGITFIAYLYFGLPIIALFKNPAGGFKWIGFTIVFFGILVAAHNIENVLDKYPNLTPRKKEILRGVVIIGMFFLLYWLFKLGAKAGIML